ncbi:hypothetical protein B0H17DRAFT_1062864, partial [Mycena rosella]
MQVRPLSTRAANAERRLNNVQNQLLATAVGMNQKGAAADAKWDEAAEERVKRERQGGKERVAELENNLPSASLRCFMFYL